MLRKAAREGAAYETVYFRHNVRFLYNDGFLFLLISAAICIWSYNLLSYHGCNRQSLRFRHTCNIYIKKTV